MSTRNSEVLKDFVAYCEANPTQRFWQALRNWAGVGVVFTETAVEGEEMGPLKDTFYYEGRDG